MKKLICLVLTLAMVGTLAISTFAQSGDVIGDIYSTDILAYVNGVEIESYNIGGKTAIAIEDLHDNEAWDYNYGVKWNYDDPSRTLTAETQTYSKYFTKKEVTRGEAGKIAGNIYQTNIKVIFNSYEVPSYSIGGKTAVCIEDLGAFDETSPNYEYGYSKYMCNFNWDEEQRAVFLNTYQEASYISFNEYPIRKLAFKFDDNKLSCSFDQMNRYLPTLDVNFSDDFKNDTYKIKPVYMNDNVIGSMYVNNKERIVTQLDYRILYNQVKDLAVILPYDEAKKYVTDNFKIKDTYEDDYASVYVASKDDKQYLLYAFKKGGFLKDMEYQNDDTAEFINKDGIAYVRVPCNGPRGIEFIQEELATSYYNFYSSFENFAIEKFSPYNQKYSRVGNGDLVIDGKNFDIDTILWYNCSEPMVNVEKMSKLLGIDYKFVNGKFVFNTYGKKHTISINTADVKSEPDAPIYLFYAYDVELNGEVSEFTYLGGGTVLTNGKWYEKSIIPYLYKTQAYVPFHFFTQLCNNV